MNTTLTLIDLAGSIALLLWGLHMVQSGVQGAFGPHLRPLSRARAPRSRPGLSRRGWRDGNLSKQHGNWADRHELCRRRAGWSGAGARGHARGQRRHHPHRAAAVVQPRAHRAAVCPDRGDSVPALSYVSDTRSRPHGDRPWTDALCAAAAPLAADALSRCTEPASADCHDCNATDRRRHPRRRAHLGGAFERAMVLLTMSPGGHRYCSATGGLCVGTGGQSRIGA